MIQTIRPNYMSESPKHYKDGITQRIYTKWLIVLNHFRLMNSCGVHTIMSSQVTDDMSFDDFRDMFQNHEEKIFKLYELLVEIKQDIKY